MSWKILVSDNLSDKGIEIFKKFPEFDVDLSTSLSPDDLKNCIGKYHGLVIRSATQVTKEIIDAADNLKVIGRAGIGLDNVDIPAASKKGIVVMNTPDGNVITTAEHAISMMMALTRNIPQATASLKAGKWEKKNLKGREVFNKTLGIIGIGRIGSIVADRAKGLKMNVIAYDPFISPDNVSKSGVEVVSFDDLLKRSDYISVHVPRSKDTIGFINKDIMLRMKKGAFLINCARGGIVVEKDLVEALESGHLAGAALDVFEVEPPKDNPLVSLPQVICTPHLGASTAEAQDNVALSVVEQIVDYLKNGTITNAVNVPSLSGDLLIKLKPFITLTEKLGSLIAQITEGGVEEVEIEFVGEVSGFDTEPITIAMLKGLLTPAMKYDVNFINATHLAKDRGIKIKKSCSEISDDYQSLINITLKTSKETNMVGGTIIGKTLPRLTQINEYRIEAIPEGNILLIYNLDKPGTVGAIGAILGKDSINISNMILGHVPGSGMNIILANIDKLASESVCMEIETLDNVKKVKRVEL